MDAYHVLERIGEGSFGRVYKGRRKYTGQFVALKCVCKSGKKDADIEALRSEVQILRGLDHENIILMLDCFETPRDVVLVTEYAHGELFSVLTEDAALPEGVVRSVAAQLVAALNYLHSHRIVHRDMKPQNVLISSGGVVKLCDFGFARQMSASTVMLTSLKGTPLYLAPETLLEQSYDYKADLWGLGVMIFELATGQPPFYANSLHSLMKMISSDTPPKYPDDMSPDLKDFLQRLLVRKPADRIGWPELLHHPFVVGAPSRLPAASPTSTTSSRPGTSGDASAGTATGAATAPAAARPASADASKCV